MRWIAVLVVSMFLVGCAPDDNPAPPCSEFSFFMDGEYGARVSIADNDEAAFEVDLNFLAYPTYDSAGRLTGHFAFFGADCWAEGARLECNYRVPQQPSTTVAGYADADGAELTVTWHYEDPYVRTFILSDFTETAGAKISAYNSAIAIPQ